MINSKGHNFYWMITLDDYNKTIEMGIILKGCYTKFKIIGK